MTRPCECATRFFTGSNAPGGCGLPSTDSLSGFLSAGNGKIQGGSASIRMAMMRGRNQGQEAAYPGRHHRSDVARRRAWG
jgi:hypothetical protein